MCNHEWDMSTASCTFGCNRTVDTDTGMCPECKDHSNNVVGCLHCDVLGDVDHVTGKITEQK
jgi:hypothetical protein